MYGITTTTTKTTTTTTTKETDVSTWENKNILKQQTGTTRVYHIFEQFDDINIHG